MEPAAHDDSAESHAVPDMGDAQHTEPGYVRLRTTVVVVSMLLLPAAAVFGVKSPGAAVAKKTDAPAPSSSKPRTPQIAANNSESESRAPGVFHQATAASMTAAGTSPSGMPSQGYEVQQAVANIDVQSSSAVVPVAHAESLGAPQPAASRPAAAPEQFTQIQQRLRALGATHYALETWGSEGGYYRFQCQMAAGHNSAYTRKFEATDTDALRAMQTVLDDVEAWKAGRMP
ncbi:MAG: hypothetical protein QM775_01540 [Pirellulales bacterium]